MAFPLAKNAFKRKQITYLGTIRESLVPDNELNIDPEWIIAFGFDKDGKLHVEVFC